MTINTKGTKHKQMKPVPDINVNVDQENALSDSELYSPDFEHHSDSMDMLDDELFEDVELLNIGTPDHTNNRRLARVRFLNDHLRITGEGGLVVSTPGFQNLSKGLKFEIVALLRAEQAFNHDNDPWQEHDFGTILVEEHVLLWKIDYFDIDRIGHSLDPSDPTVTSRVLTLMLATEY